MKLQRTISLIALLLASATIALAESEHLPEKTAELLKKLRTFEIAQSVECDKKILEAERAALAVLAEHRERESKAGNLDTAVALKAIAKIPEDSEPSPEIPEDSKAAIRDFHASVKALRAELQDRLAKKKIAVARILQQQVIEETKKQNLEGALAVRAELRKLPAIPKEPEKAEEPKRAGFFEPKTEVRGSLGKIVGEPGAIEVTKTKATPLLPDVDFTSGKTTKKWVNIPPKLVELGISIHWPTDSNGGVAEYKVTSPGYVMIACDYAYQGNSGGGWQETRWTAEDFMDNGWKELSESKMGGKLVNRSERELKVFYKKLKAGDEGKLRCNKYGPPLFLTFPK